MADENDQPPWLAAELFPPKPTPAPYGVIGAKGVLVEFTSLEDLADHVGTARNTVAAIWTPESERTIPVEGEPRLVDALRKRTRRIAEVELSNARQSAFIFGAITLWALVAAWMNRGDGAFWENQQLGLAALLLFWFGLIPLYEGFKLRRESERMDTNSLQATEREARFEFWLTLQRMPVTMVLLGLLVAVAAAQVAVGWGDRSFFGALLSWGEEAILKAGLLKSDLEIAPGVVWHGGYLEGEYWRLWTGPLLHGGALHLGMNGFALWYLGRRSEALARWPHLAMAFLTALWIGGLASVYLMPDKPSVGASGGVMGLLGFLIAFETLHARLVPRRARKRLAVAVVTIFVIGAVGWSFIDNAAHAGGLVAGMVYAVIVFPKSRSARRPSSTKLDLVLGLCALAALTGSALLAIYKILG